MRTLAQSGVLPTVLRLSDEAETSINLAKPAEVGREQESESGGCLMVTGYEGTQEAVDAKRTACTALLSGLGGTSLGEDVGWSTGPVPRSLPARLDAGRRCARGDPRDRDVLVQLRRVYDAVKHCADHLTRRGHPRALPHLARLRDRCLALLHRRHEAVRRPTRPVARRQAAASDAIIDNGASITHHHAVGQDHKPWLAREIGPVGVRMLRALKAELDPTGVLNPGVLIP